MSPVFTSPTKGPTLCGINVTDTAMHSVMLLLFLCGLCGNGTVLWLFHSRRTHRNLIVIYIFHQASNDFCFLMLVPCIVLYMTKEMSISHDWSKNYLMAFMAQALFCYNMGLCLLTAIIIERCRSILCPLWCRCHYPLHLSKVVDNLLTAIYVSFLVTVNPLCLLHKHKQEHIQVALISMYTLNLILFAFCMVISSMILFIKVKRDSQQQQLKRLDIVIFLSVLFGLPFSLWNFLQQLGYACVSTHLVMLFSCIHCTIKPYISFLVARCWRHCSMVSLRLSLQEVFKEPEEDTTSSNDAVMDTVV